MSSITHSGSNWHVVLKNPFNCKYGRDSGGQRFFFQNIFEALDSPGEFYYDRESRVLYYVAMDGEDDMNKLDCVVAQHTYLLHGSGVPTSTSYVEYVHFIDVTFEYAEVEADPCFDSYCNSQSASFLTTAAVHLYWCRNWLLSHVVIAHVGGYGVWLQQGVFDSIVEYSHIFDLGAGGVRVGPPASGVESRTAWRVVSNTITDCVIEDGGYYYKMGVGVFAQQVQSLTVQHNEIYKFYYTGVSVGWTWGYADTSVSDNLVAYNEIHSIGMGLLSDMACVYTLGHQPGTVIRNNECYDVDSYGYGGWGLYTDEGSRDIIMRDNLVHHTKCAGYHQHYGTDNTITNNVFAYVDQLGTDGAFRSSQWAGQCNQTNPNGCCASFSFTKNVLFVQDGSMVGEPRNEGFKNMTIDYNTYWNVEDGYNAKFLGNNFSTFQKSSGKDAHSQLSDPLFKDAAHDDFALKSDSPAFALGFKALDLSTVGPRDSAGATALVSACCLLLALAACLL
eukprot:TRINITY_DN5032_c0_g1_i1.p1 TRINITY_DN5032_c0_g1~~TRINITY_DN5032_c0_g1_i1.p1  ORF type:complete len:504 (+),score=81.35 TRINITY_DN5032_c0_g1_i1:660-2171(+)